MSVEGLWVTVKRWMGFELRNSSKLPFICVWWRLENSEWATGPVMFEWFMIIFFRFWIHDQNCTWIHCCIQNHSSKAITAAKWDIFADNTCWSGCAKCMLVSFTGITYFIFRFRLITCLHQTQLGKEKWKNKYAAAADCSTVVDWEDKLVLVLAVTVWVDVITLPWIFPVAWQSKYLISYPP